MDKQEKVTAALLLAAQGWTLFRIAQHLGVTKEWLRHYAGLR